MSLPEFRSSPDAPDFNEAAVLSYDQALTYDEGIDPGYNDFTDPDSEEDSQEWYAHKQK